VPPALPAAGWYPDPWAAGAWRWWDGRSWTGHVRTVGRAPRLPAWLSPPVLVGIVLVVPLLLVAVITDPLATLLPVPSFLVLLAVFVWFDRLEPEPRAERVHAVLWGATITIVVAGFGNGLAALIAGEAVATVLVAPVTEEVMKAVGILYAVRRRSIDSVIDGVVYAGWIGAGFALVENVEYFVFASAEGALVPVLVARGVLAPFAHPLFTVWIGIAVGRAVVRGRDPIVGALPGLALAIVLHALWNLATVVAGGGGLGWALLLALGFVGLFVGTAIVLVVGRLRGRDEFVRAVPAVALRYGLTAEEVLVFSDWGRILAVRRSLPPRTRRAFDARHAAIARLVAWQRRSGPPDPVGEARLVAALWEARGRA
jgi:protease PrsW